MSWYGTVGVKEQVFAVLSTLHHMVCYVSLGDDCTESRAESISRILEVDWDHNYLGTRRCNEKYDEDRSADSPLLSKGHLGHLHTSMTLLISLLPAQSVVLGFLLP